MPRFAAPAASLCPFRLIPVSCTRRLTIIPPKCLTADTGEVNEFGSLRGPLPSFGPGFLLSASLNFFAWRLYVIAGEQIVSEDDRQFDGVGAYPFFDGVERGDKTGGSCRQCHDREVIRTDTVKSSRNSTQTFCAWRHGICMSWNTRHEHSPRFSNGHKVTILCR